MNNTEQYKRYALCREMMETPDLVRGFDESVPAAIELASGNVLLSGEGSSRIFPAKRAIAQALRRGTTMRIITEAALQAIEYDLSGYHVFVASNSGRTAEGVELIRSLGAGKNAAAAITGVVTNDGTPIATEADNRVVLQCGPEQAVAATKSVIEQALVYDLILRRADGYPSPDRAALAAGMDAALRVDLDPAIVRRAVSAPMIYFAGRNDGVAEELTLKTNEITRKRADYLEGTYAVHGVEEIMSPEDLVVLIDPYPSQEEKFDRVLRQGVGMEVIAISSGETRFPTIRVPFEGELGAYVLMAAGWNLLVEIGLAAGVDPDTPERARKVGNEFTEPAS